MGNEISLNVYWSFSVSKIASHEFYETKNEPSQNDDQVHSTVWAPNTCLERDCRRFVYIIVDRNAINLSWLAQILDNSTDDGVVANDKPFNGNDITPML